MKYEFQISQRGNYFNDAAVDNRLRTELRAIQWEQLPSRVGLLVCFNLVIYFHDQTNSEMRKICNNARNFQATSHILFQSFLLWIPFVLIIVPHFS